MDLLPPISILISAGIFIFNRPSFHFKMIVGVESWPSCRKRDLGKRREEDIRRSIVMGEGTPH